jgi:hypothetical protein
VPDLSPRGPAVEGYSTKPWRRSVNVTPLSSPIRANDNSCILPAPPFVDRFKLLGGEAT